jgi:hypothetical protein
MVLVVALLMELMAPLAVTVDLAMMAVQVAKEEMAKMEVISR